MHFKSFTRSIAGLIFSLLCLLAAFARPVLAKSNGDASRSSDTPGLSELSLLPTPLTCKQLRRRPPIQQGQQPTACALGPPPTTRAMFVSDSGNARVLEYLANESPPFFTTGMSANVVFGQPDFTSSEHNLTQTGMSKPESAAIDGSGDMWSADFDYGRVLEFVPPFTPPPSTDSANLVIGEPNFTTNNTYNPPEPSQSNLSGGAVGVAFDGTCNMYVSDFRSNRVLQFLAPFSNGMNANLVFGQSDFTSFGTDDSLTGFQGPQFINFDNSGNLWVADYGNDRVLEFVPPFAVPPSTNSANLAITLVSKSPSSNLSKPFGVAFDACGDLWVADTSNNRVLEFLPPYTSGANLVVGQSDFRSGDAPGAGPAGLSDPRAVAFDSAGYLYVTDYGNNRVMIFAPPFTTGMNARSVIGQPDLMTTTPTTTATGLTSPQGVTIGPWVFPFLRR